MNIQRGPIVRHTYIERSFREINGGNAGFQVEREGLKVTVMIRGDEDRLLVGSAFVTSRPMRAWTDETRWVSVVGAGIMLDGGVELHIRMDELFENLEEFKTMGVTMNADTLVPVTIFDAYLPEMEARVRMDDLMYGCQRMSKGQGPRSSVQPSPCEHYKPKNGCPECFRKWWRARLPQAS